jgi:hypothetical protein
MRYPADPPNVEEIVLVMRRAGDRAHVRLRGRGDVARGPADWRSAGADRE